MKEQNKQDRIEEMKGGVGNMTQISQETKEKLRKIRQSQKVGGVPRLTQKIDAMYDNICRGNLMAYYLDGDPVRQDPVYSKLKGLERQIIFFDTAKAYQKVAWHYKNNMKSRQMTERMYEHIRRTPLWALKLEFTIRHETDKDLRRAIGDDREYMYRSEDKEWIE